MASPLSGAKVVTGAQPRPPGAGNLFTVFGEPDVNIKEHEGELVVELLGVDVYDPTTGEVRSNSTDDVACWFVDTNYNQESFFVRHAYFTCADEPYERLQRTLRAEIDEEAWTSLYSTVSRPFPKPETGRIAVKVINHYGDEVLKVYDVWTRSTDIHMSEHPWYEELRSAYRPAHIRVVFVGESAPDPGAGRRRFFYSPELTHDNLFRGVMLSLYDASGDQLRRRKPEWLQRFQRDGFWLLDVADRPLNKLTPSERSRERRLAAELSIARVSDAQPSSGVIICHGPTFH